jgi:hypothetical protein
MRYSDQIKEDETGYVTHMEDIRNASKFWTKNLKVSYYLGYIGINGRIIMKWILKNIGCEVVDWIQPALVT